MQDVGTFLDRNKTFSKNFTRKTIISKCFEGKIYPIILDIGSHHGESLKFFKEISPNAHVYCFEPDPESYAILKKNFPDHSDLYNLAVSDIIGHESFYRNPISHTNSLYKVNLESNDSIKIQQEKETKTSEFLDVVNQPIIVSSSTLDTIISDHKIDQIDLLKIDVQGAETKVLNGARNILHMVNSIVVEVAFFDFYEKSNNFSDIENTLIPAGFNLFSILDISQNPMNGRTDWVEVLYRRVNK